MTMFPLRHVFHSWTWVMLLLAIQLLLSLSCAKNVAMPDYPAESSMHAAFGRIAIALAESGVSQHPVAQWKLFVKTPQNHADNWMRGANGSLMPLELEDFTQMLCQMCCSPEMYHEQLAHLRSHHRTAWEELCAQLQANPDTYQPPQLSAPLFSGVRHQLFGDCRATLEVECRYETEHEDFNHLQNHLVIQARIVDLETGEELFRHTVHLDQKWRRKLF